MQMYKVSFHSQRGALVDTGTFLVCARSAPDAEQMVAGAASVPPSTATFETVRVKPSVFELSRSEFKKTDLPAFVSGSNDPGAIHEIRVSAKVFAYSESGALRRLAGAVTNHASSNKSGAGKHVDELNIEIERADCRPRRSRVDEQSIYKEKRFFAGGAARPR